MNDKIKSKLQKLYTLANRGENCKREAARAMLDKLLKKHNGTEEDLDTDIPQKYVLEYHKKTRLRCNLTF